MVMSSSERILGHCVAFDHPDSNGSRQMAQMLRASIAWTYLDGDFVILRNHEEPIFRLPSEGIDELFIEMPALENQALADLGNAWHQAPPNERLFPHDEAKTPQDFLVV